MELFDHIFLVLLLVLMVTSTILMSSTINNVLRQKRPRISVISQSGDAGRNRLISLLVVIIVGLTVRYSPNKVALLSTLCCYAWIGTMLFLSHYLASRCYVCKNGIVPDINNTADSIVHWNEIVDFAERKLSGGSEYVFSYTAKRNVLGDMARVKQIKIIVPQQKRLSFEKIVSSNLKNRFDNSNLPKIDLKDLQTG